MGSNLLVWQPVGSRVPGLGVQSTPENFSLAQNVVLTMNKNYLF